jgi:hypothetical protein
MKLLMNCCDNHFFCIAICFLLALQHKGRGVGRGVSCKVRLGLGKVGESWNVLTEKALLGGFWQEKYQKIIFL